MSQTLSKAPQEPSFKTSATIRNEGGGGRNFGRFYIVHMLGSVFPLSAGALLYGWRAMAVLLTALASTLFATLIWQRIGRRGGSLHIPHAIWLAILLTMMLPPHLLVGRDVLDLHSANHAWMIVPGACILLVMLMWLTGGVGFSRVHPLLLTFLTLVLLFHQHLDLHLVLHRTKMLTGDLAHFTHNNVPVEPIRSEPWSFARDEPPTDALYVDRVASQELIRSEEHTS